MVAGCQATAPLQPPATQPASPHISLTTTGIAQTLSQVRAGLDARMVIQFTDPATGKRLQCPPDAKIPTDAMFISCTGYPAGVIYAGMLNDADATGDKQFSDFVAKRFDFFSQTIPKTTSKSKAYQSWLSPRSLDSCGAMGAAFVKANMAQIGGDLHLEIDRFADFVSNKQFRLKDGTLARQRPFNDSLWADDMYMSVPFLAQLAVLINQSDYYDDAAKQVVQISARLFVPSTGLYTHGWNAQTGDNQPHYYWGRANGWCMMAMVELLEVLPENHPRRAEILGLLRAQAKGVASLQSGTGLWHQMLDRPDSYLETSCSAMFTFAMARAVNRGWLDARAYTPVAIAGWCGVASKIDPQGHVTGTCVGTSYADDYPYYYNRKNTDDEHGYGAVLLAGGELIKLLKNPRIHVQDEPGRPVMILSP